MAYVVGRRAGTAVVRNRIRRRLRAAVAAHAPQLERGGVYLVGADRGAMTMPFTQLVDQVGSLVRGVTAEDGRS